MTGALDGIDRAVAAILAATRQRTRRMVALVGPPASGKTTLAAELAQTLTSRGVPSCVVPMDGFHLDNAILKTRGSLTRKGSPETFDVAGFASLIARLSDGAEVFFPTFDRSLDRAIAGSGLVVPDTDTVIVEGNYLMLQKPVWAELLAHWDLSIALDVPMDLLRDRLVRRWRDHGLSTQAAVKRATDNDLPNAETVIRDSAPADHVIHVLE